MYLLEETQLIWLRVKMKNASITYVYVISFLMRWPHGEEPGDNMQGENSLFLCFLSHCGCSKIYTWNKPVLRSNENYSVPQPHEAGGSQEKHAEH